MQSRRYHATFTLSHHKLLLFTLLKMFLSLDLMSNQPNKNNPSHPPSKVPPGRGPPRMVPQPNNPPSSFDYNGPPGKSS